MGERRTKLVPVRVDILCPKCEGEMMPDGTVLTVYPPLYPHTCQRVGCGHRQSFTTHSGAIVYEEAPDAD